MSAPVSEVVVWLILGLPVASFVLIAALYPVLRRYPAPAGWIAMLAIGGSLGISVWLLMEAIGAAGRPLDFETHELVDVGSLLITIGIRLDGLTAVMMVVVTAVSFLVQVYSTGYMRGDRGYARYFAYMSLFTAAMLGLVLVDNLVVLFAFWELVGLASYLLIGFWFHKPAAAAAAKKAFLVTRAGDLGLLAALIFIWVRAGTLDIATINTEVVGAVELGLLGADDPDIVCGRAGGGRGWQKRAVSAAYLVAGCDGGTDAGLCAYPRGDDGRGGGLPVRPLLPGAGGIPRPRVT